MREIISPLSGIRSPFGGRSLTSPLALFAFGEPGVWFDPSDVANLNWRRNLLTWTEQFDNAAWTLAGPTVVANTSTAPNGTLTADLLRSATSSSGQFIGDAGVSTSATTHTTSVYLKASGYSWAILYAVGPNVGVHFDVQNGVVGSTFVGAPTSSSITPVGNGWFRCSITFTATTSVSSRIYIRSSDGGGAFAGDGTSGILMWGAQLELGSTATDYQRITDVNTEVIERFPNATLYQDTAGTTPVTTTGQSVGLMLDKSKGLVADTTNKVTENFTGWTQDAVGVTGSQLAPDGTSTAFNVVPTAVSSDHRVRQSSTYVQGQHYAFSVYAKANGYNFIKLEGTSGGVGGVVFNVSTGVVVSGTGGTISAAGNGYFKCTFRFFQSAADATSAFNNQIRISSDGTTFAFTGNGTSGVLMWKPELLFYLGLGNHAVQATTANRPIYGVHPFGGRRNLLVRTEEFDNAVWSTSTLTKTANIAVAPDGTTTADRLTCSVTATENNIRFASSQTNATTFTFSCYVKAGSAGARLYLRNIAIDSSSTNGVVQFNPENGTVSLTYGSTYIGNASMTDVGGGWYRCRISGTTGNPIANNLLDIGVTNGATAGGGVVGLFVDIWGAQLETGSTATAYQRVTDQYNVTEAGVSSVSYLFFDGVNDSLATPSINFTSTDKMTVFAGVRKLSDAAIAVVAELTASLSANTGSFALFSPISASNTYAFGSRGSALQGFAVGSGFAAPITSVLTGIGNISGDNITLRVNGTQAAQSADDQGTGNYANAIIYIGARAGSSIFFSGHLYSLIVRGAQSNTGQISSTETWVAGKTGITI
jgi:hypothetical protein